jgi:ribose/xylose/arabinose/galactoside ABC-type transport system permease subunit
MKLKKILIEWNRYGLILAFLLWCVALVILQPVFISSENLMNILRQISMVSIIAIGSFLVVLTGGIDLSVGAVAALSGVICAILLKSLGLPIAVGMLGGVLMGVSIGVLNGLMVTRIRMAAFIATLITMNFAKGIAFILTNGRPVSGLPPAFIVLGRGYLWFIPIPVIIMIVIYLATAYILGKTRFGLRVYGIGGNAEAVRLAGVPVQKYLNAVYLISGAAAGFAGVILASRLNSGSPNVGETYVFDAITAIVLGGTSLAGGTGNIFGVFLGSVFMGTLSNGLNLLNVPAYYQLICKAVLLAAAVSLDIRGKHARG